MYTIVRNQKAFEEALKLARGRYQRNLLYGRARLSGTELRGKAKRYGASYWRSRYNFMERLRRARLGREERGDHGKRVLVIDYFAENR